MTLPSSSSKKTFKEVVSSPSPPTLNGRHSRLPSSSSSSSLSSNGYPPSSSSPLNLYRLPCSSRYNFFFPSFDPEYVARAIRRNIGVATDNNARVSFPFVEKKPTYYKNHEDNKRDRSSKDECYSDDDYMDVLSLLSSSKGDELFRVGCSDKKNIKATSLRGKHVIVCCAFSPSLWIEKNSCDLRKLSLLSLEMSHKGMMNDIEIVIVVKMRRQWANDERVFNHFLSAFPGCLAVPFRDKHRRDDICKSLEFDGELKAVLINNWGAIIMRNLQFIVGYGAAAFPFSSYMIDSFKEQWRERWNHTCCRSLKELLQCESSFVLRKFKSRETVSVEQLSEKLVGLYLFKEGDKFCALYDMYRRCKEQGLDIEIVLVYLPYLTSIQPYHFQRVVNSFLDKLGVSDWWIFPFENSACSRLFNLSDRSRKDAMVIIGPNGEFVDGHAGEVIYSFGNQFGIEGYPFTQESLVQACMKRIRGVTLESLLCYGNVNYVYRAHARVHVAALQGKNVFVYLDNPTSMSEWNLEQLSQWYPKMCKRYSEFELVFVSTLGRRTPNAKYKELFEKFKSMNWLIRPFDDLYHTEYMKNHDAFVRRSSRGVSVKGLRVPSVLAFGKDGRINSIDALNLVLCHGIKAFPDRFEEKILRREIYRLLKNDFEFMRGRKIKNNVISNDA